MTRPRSEIVDRENGGIYHLGSRCVRRALLCGKDSHTGRDFSHRRAWIEDRLLELAELFTVHICTYAVMSNHYHITANYTPQERFELENEEVARRWLRLHPPKRPDQFEPSVAALLDDTDRLAALRDRLGDLSWYMRCLNEPIARRANLEDDCTGRSWQGRFRSKGLPDERAMWASIAYDDLNPIRAGMAEDVDDDEHVGMRNRAPATVPATQPAPPGSMMFQRNIAAATWAT
ncbi:MAG: transposase [Gammaproteobacteria bacterium]|nr:transposase [Gammaproteobacteria bacterium]